MYVDENAVTSINPVTPTEAPSPETTTPRSPSDSYQKVLDYHLGEILLTSIIIGIILLLRLHR